MIKFCDKSDIDWILEAASKCYPEFNHDIARNWLSNNIGNPDCFMVRGENAGAMATITKPFFAPPEFGIDFLFSSKPTFGGAETLSLIRFLNNVRKNLGYDKTWVNSRITNLSPLINRLGGKVGEIIWTIED